MTHQTVCAALWAGLGSQVLLQRLHEQPLLQRTLQRVQASNLGAAYVLVPWLSENDALAEEVKSWKTKVSRCHPIEQAAMRDLVVRLGADHGILVYGEAADVDPAEVALAAWRLKRGVGEHVSPRIKAFPMERWLRNEKGDEGWEEPIRPIEELRRFFAYPGTLDEDTRTLRARVDRAPSHRAPRG